MATKKPENKKAAKKPAPVKETGLLKVEARPIGRPSIYSEKLATEICFRISNGESLKRICTEDRMPNISTIFEWLIDGKHTEFADKYAQARESQAEHIFLELLQLSDTSVDDITGMDRSDSARVQARKLQIDTRKWVLARMFPKKFGDKLDVTSDGDKIEAVPIYGGMSTKKPK